MQGAKKYSSILIPIFILILFYQNCSSGFESIEFALQNSHSNNSNLLEDLEESNFEQPDESASSEPELNLIEQVTTNNDETPEQKPDDNIPVADLEPEPVMPSTPTASPAPVITPSPTEEAPPILMPDTESNGLITNNTLAELFKDLQGYASGAQKFNYDSIYMVNSTSDSNTKGTLRYAIETSKEKLWIKFDPKVFTKGKKIVLNSALRITRSDILLDGRGAHVEITSSHNWKEARNVAVAGRANVYQCELIKKSSVGLILIYSSERVIITDINFKQNLTGDTGLSKEAYIDTECFGDQILVYALDKGKFDNIWINNSVFSNCMDECISFVRANGRSNVSISNSIFQDTNKGIIAGNAADDNMEIYLSLYKNYFKNVSQRSPRLRSTVAHIYKNTFENWQLYSLGIDLDTRVIVENNIYLSNNSQTKAIYHFNKNNSSVYSRNNNINGSAMAPSKSFLQTKEKGGPSYYTDKMAQEAY